MKINSSLIVLMLLITAAVGITAQTKRTARPVKPKEIKTSQPQPTQSPTPEAVKSNMRPASGDAVNAKGQNHVIPTHFYEFVRPGFTYEKVVIEHDDTGRGTISLMRSDFDEMVTDPVLLSEVTLGKIGSILSALNFLDSTEDYQYSKDYSHLGTMTFKVVSAGRERTATYNWTDNKQAKMLLDEYRRIGNEYIWRFEISIARENQPLQTPGLIDSIDSLVKRGEISDPTNLLPFLRELSTDERLPLMARNHAVNLITKIDKLKRSK